METLVGILKPVAQHLPPELVAQVSAYGIQMWQTMNPYIRPVLAHVERNGSVARSRVNELLAGVDAATSVLVTVTICFLLHGTLKAGLKLLRPFSERGVLPVIFGFLRSLPPFASMIVMEKTKLRDGILAQRQDQQNDQLMVLPRSSTPAALVRERLKQRAAKDVQVKAHAPRKFHEAARPLVSLS